jgi:hypothetical protein
VVVTFATSRNKTLFRRRKIMNQTTNSTQAQETNNVNIFAAPETEAAVTPKIATFDSSPFETTPPMKDEAEAVVASEVTQVEGSEAAQDAQAETTPEVSEESAPAQKNTTKLAKRMSLEKMREYAEPIAQACKKQKDGIYTISLSTVSDAAKCDKTIATKIIRLAMDITKSYIQIVDDKPSTSVTDPQVNTQHSLIIPSKKMQSIKGDDGKMLFPVGTKFTMTYDAEKIVLTKLA